MKFTLLFTLLILLTVLGCGKRETSTERPETTFSTYSSGLQQYTPETGKREINYGLLTPTEITTMFSKLGIQRDNSIVNPTSNSDLYTSNSKAALNLGIYGVDFGYIKMFGFGQQMIDYVLTIRDISNKLGIPEKLLMDPLKKIDSDMSDSDSLMALVNKSYSDIESHLRKDGRESTAGLMLMGGWIEAMYITTQLLYNPQNPDSLVVEKIAQQKYSLTSLLGFMRNYYDDPVVVFYTKKLIFLKRYFDTFEIYFKKGDLEIDTTRQVLKATGSDLTISPETLNNIREYVYKLRNEIVSP